jgi:hypothetical protein
VGWLVDVAADGRTIRARGRSPGGERRAGGASSAFAEVAAALPRAVVGDPPVAPGIRDRRDRHRAALERSGAGASAAFADRKACRSGVGSARASWAYSCRERATLHPFDTTSRALGNLGERARGRTGAALTVDFAGRLSDSP